MTRDFQDTDGEMGFVSGPQQRGMVSGDDTRALGAPIRKQAEQKTQPKRRPEGATQVYIGEDGKYKTDYSPKMSREQAAWGMDIAAAWVRMWAGVHHG